VQAKAPRVIRGRDDLQPCLGLAVEVDPPHRDAGDEGDHEGCDRPGRGRPVAEVGARDQDRLAEREDDEQNAGAVIAQEGDDFGRTVNVASRIADSPGRTRSW
jgi:hypothetical protein